MSMADSELLAQLNSELKNAMKSGDKRKTEVLRFLKANLQNLMLAKRESFSPDDETAFLMVESKRRKEAIQLYERGNRPDLVDREQFELDLITRYLPEQLGDEELKRMVQEVIAQAQATSSKDVGRVMGIIMPKIKGKADGKRVQDIVKQQLQARDENE